MWLDLLKFFEALLYICRADINPDRWDFEVLVASDARVDEPFVQIVGVFDAVDLVVLEGPTAADRLVRFCVCPVEFVGCSVADELRCDFSVFERGLWD